MREVELLLGRFKQFADQLEQIDIRMSDPVTLQDMATYQRLAKERSGLVDRVEKFNVFRKLCQELERLEALLSAGIDDKEFLALVQEELPGLRQRQRQMTEELEDYLLAPDPRQDKDIIMEIRAGTGGDEAALFAADLFRMYRYYAEQCGFKVEIMSASPTELGGYKEIIFSVEGRGAYRKFHFESGVHRVQRVPSTEASGRIHTSAVSVAVLPEAEEVDVQIKPQDIKVDVFRSMGAGGQSVNTTDSAVRITHLATGMVVICQDERSQLKNRAKAMKVLCARLMDAAVREQDAKISQERRTQIGSGDRSEKIRTYNFPDRRVTDHRIGLTVYRIEQVLEGDLEEIITALLRAERTLKLGKSFNQNGKDGTIASNER